MYVCSLGSISDWLTFIQCSWWELNKQLSRCVPNTQQLISHCYYSLVLHFTYAFYLRILLRTSPTRQTTILKLPWEWWKLRLCTCTLLAVLIVLSECRQTDTRDRNLCSCLPTISLSLSCHQVTSLSGLRKLEQLSLMNNPCTSSSYEQMNHHSHAYRAYIISCAANLQVLDGQHVTTTERYGITPVLPLRAGGMM